MHSRFNGFSGTNCRRGRFEPVTRNSNTRLIIRDFPENSYCRLFAWVMAGAALVTGVQCSITSQNVSAAAVLSAALLGCAALMVRKITTEIDLARRTVRKRWQLFVFSWHKVYSLDDYATAEIQAGSQLVEGYSLSFFTVSLVGTDRHIKVYSTDDHEEAVAVQKEVAGFFNNLNKSGEGKRCA